MDSKKPNKIRDIVRLQQILKKWRKLANSSSKPSTAGPGTNRSSSSNSKSIQFLKRTLSLSDRSSSSTAFEASGSNTSTSGSSSSNTSVPKGYLAVSVGEEQKRFVIPTEYLGRHVFHVLLREAEEEFGFEQSGVLRIPCEVSVFEKVLKMVEDNRDDHYFIFLFDRDHDQYLGCCSSQGFGFSHHSDHSPLCR